MKDNTTVADAVLSSLMALLCDRWQKYSALEDEWTNIIAYNRRHVGSYERVRCDMLIPYTVTADDIVPAVEAALLKHRCGMRPINFEPHPYRFDTTFYNPIDSTGGVLTITLGGIENRSDVARLFASVLPCPFFTQTVQILEVAVPVADELALV